MSAREPLTPEARERIAALISEARPARDGLLTELAESVRDRREHDHTTQREDWFCLNLTSFMGERMGPVLRRLMDAEAEVERLRARVAELTQQTTTATEYRVGAPTGLSLYVRRAPGRDGWAVFEARTTREGRRAWTPDGWQMLALLAHSEMHCWPDDVTALAEARKALTTEGGVR